MRIGCDRRQRRCPGLFSISATIAVLTVFGPTGSLAMAQTAPLVGNHSPAVTELKAPRPAAPDRQLTLKFVFALRNQAELDRLLAEQQKPGSPEYHHWLTPSEFATRFGPRASDVQAVTEWLKGQGFNIVSRGPGNRSLTCTGIVSQTEQALGVTIVVSGDGRLFGNSADPMIPARFAGVISHIDGLDNLRRAVPLIRRRPAPGSRVEPVSPAFAGFKRVAFVDESVAAPAGSGQTQPGLVVGGVGPAFGPSDLQTFYDEQPLFSRGISGGSGDCIALVEDSDYLDAAVTKFVTQFGLTAASITRVFSDSTDPGINSDESEALLDLEWAHAVAPGTQLRAYIGNPSSSSNPITDSIRNAVDDNSCGEISISFGFCGAPSTFYTGTLDPIFQQAASQGQSVFVSSGDDGAAGLILQGSKCVPGTSRNVNEMSADPNVTSVGGTEFTPTYNGSGDDVGFVAENVWDEATSIGAGGGGASAIFPKPAYQTGVTPADGKRDVPDVSMIASPDKPGVFLGDDNQGAAVIDCCWGGTSLAAPIWAGITNLIVQIAGARQGNINPHLYQMASLSNASAFGFRDVTTGDNNFNGVTGFSATTGYDQATGWGSVDVNGFVSAVDGIAPVTLKYHPAGLGFPKTAELGGTGSTSRSRNVVIANPASTRKKPGWPVTITGLNPPAQFGVDTAHTTCAQGGILQPGQACVVALNFTPSSPGLQTGSFAVTTNALNNPTVALQGMSVQGALTYTPRKLNLGKVLLGTTSAAKELTLINRNPVPMSMSGINVGGPGFALATSSNPCGSSLGPGASCTVAVTFTPAASGEQFGTVSIADDAVASPQTVNLVGVGVAP